MKIIKATWENRNLGCDAYEITLDADDLKCVEKAIREIEQNDFTGCYVTLKCPVGNLEIVHRLEDIGFRFMETQLTLVKDTKNYKTPDFIKRFDNMLSNRVVSNNSAEWDEIIKRIPEDMFISDRIFLDNLLPKETAAKRYKNWCMDMKKDDSYVMVVYENVKTKKCVAFDIVKLLENGKIHDGIMGGAFPGEVGIGVFAQNQHFKFASETGAEKFVAHISSNNLPILKIYSLLGTAIISESYVFRKF